jgi:LmbE family N-acetylglucosaminyl deacetylase
MQFSRPDADVFVPAGGDPAAALARVTHLCVGAHQDDIEIMAQAGIDECRADGGLAFGGVVVTDGGGSARTGRFASLTDAQMRDVRREEQREAARLGGYAIQVQLAHPSAVVKAGRVEVTQDLGAIFRATSPRVVYLHNPADKHDTHVAVFHRCLLALRSLPREKRPVRVFGCEVWRGLDWLAETDKVALDAGRDPELAARLLRVFASQIEGGKRYDDATLGRRAANATFHTSHAVDGAKAVTWAMDLTPLVRDEKLDVVNFTLSHVDRLRTDIVGRLKKFGPGH